MTVSFCKAQVFWILSLWISQWLDWTMDQQRQREKNRDSPLLPHFPSTFPEIFYVFKSKSLLPRDIFNHCGLKECVWWDERGATSVPPWALFFFFSFSVVWSKKRKKTDKIKLISLQSSPRANLCLGRKTDGGGWGLACVSALNVPLVSCVLMLPLWCCRFLFPF